MNFLFVNQCEYLNDSHYCLEKNLPLQFKHTHTRIILYVNLLKKALSPGSEGVDKIDV